MADFRRCIPVFVVLALLLGAATANAQFVPTPFGCTATLPVPPTVRAEGLTELIGDIVLTCSGGTPTLQTGTTPATRIPIPTANVTVFLNTTVTSRILNTTTGGTEALLMIDEPGSPSSPVTTPVLCPAGPGFCPVFATSTTLGVPGVNPFIAGPNTFQGVINNPNSITFIGVPIEPPGSVGVRVFRITNIRANASAVPPSGAIPGTITASVSITGPTSVPLASPVNPAAFTQFGIAGNSATVVGPAAAFTAGAAGLAARTFLQCNGINDVGVGQRTPTLRVRFVEGFATAWKLRGGVGQATPGAIYNSSESGFTGPASGLFSTFGAAPNGSTAGVADFATRLKVTFAGLPAGVRVFVPITVGAAAGAPVATTATLVVSELAPFAPTPQTDTFGGTVAVAEVPLTNGGGSAAYEVTAISPTATDSIDVPVYFYAPANPGNNLPAPGSGSVIGSFAPTFDTTATPAAALASAVLPIPRFVITESPVNIINIILCRTILLYPFVSNQAGFDTGLAIANTSADTTTGAAKTIPQTGTCSLNFFGSPTTAAFTTPAIAGGSVYVNLLSAVASGFQGYLIAVCQFEYAHGFAYIADVGSGRSHALGYLSLIIPDTTPLNQPRPANNAGGPAGTGEGLSQ